MKDEITISKQRYLSLIKDEAEIIALETNGVDNWIGYEDCDWDSVEAAVEEAKKEFE